MTHLEIVEKLEKLRDEMEELSDEARFIGKPKFGDDIDEIVELIEELVA
jgi:hypothetical protein